MYHDHYMKPGLGDTVKNRMHGTVNYLYIYYTI